MKQANCWKFSFRLHFLCPFEMWVDQLDFFCSGIQFYLLLSPYLCFISFLFLDLYVLGDDALISWGSFMQTKYLCVLIHIWTKGEVGAPLNRFKPSSKIFYWPFQGGTSFVDLLCFFCLLFAMHLYTSVYMCLVVTCRERGDLLALVCGVLLWVRYFPIGILGQVWFLIVSIPDLCPLTYFEIPPNTKRTNDMVDMVLLLWIFYAFSVFCLLCLCTRLFICALWSPAGKGVTSWLSFVVSYCESVTFLLVSWVRCGSWLYRFLIFAPLLTLKSHQTPKEQMIW